VLRKGPKRGVMIPVLCFGNEGQSTRSIFFFPNN
jgi:hypothetical protein